MGKYTGKLLVSDMDATLLNSEHMVSEENRRAIEYFIAEGGKFTVASGRMVPAVKEYFKQMSINAPAILHNGAKIYDYLNECTIFEKFIEDERKQAIYRVHDTRSEFGLEIYSNEIVYVYNPCFETERFKTKNYKVIYSLPDEIKNEPWIKALVIGNEKQLNEFEPIYRKEYDTGYSVRSGKNYLDIVANGVSKGTGLLKLTEFVDIDIENVYAVGDNMNDVDMLKAAGHSFAVANAEEIVKNIADEVIPSCDNNPISYIIDNL